ncbi:MAG TPA: S8 family serine peptidase [Phycisphaerales bacterium]|nr:S8 family serine peptidase [Phycisphaerales bacterium]
MMTHKRGGDVCVGAVALFLSAGLAVAASGMEATMGEAAMTADVTVAMRHTLDLRTGPVDTRKLPNLLQGAGGFDAGIFYVVQIDGPLNATRQAALEDAGVKLGQYIPNHAYIANLGQSTPAAIANLGFVTWVGTMPAEWKVDPELGVRPLKDAQRLEDRANGIAKVTVILHENASAIDAVDAINAGGGQVLDLQVVDADTYIEANVAMAAVPALAAVDSVMFIEEAGEIGFRNDSNRWIAQSNVSAQTPVWNAGIQGQGQIAGIIDGPVRESHCMFDDTVAMGPTHRKIIAMRGSAGSDSHGTHVAGTVAGDNAPYEVYTTNDGLAFRAKISFTNLSSVSSANLETTLNSAYTDGARAHSNSWGDDGTTSYTSHCRQIDSHSYLKEDSLVLFASTNLSTLKTPENAKNVLAVGASNDANSQGSFCSGGAGPTNDGRRKPEAFLPGCNTISANSGTTCGTTGMSGTSMACPAVTGAAVLVRQYYTDGFYPTGGAVPANAFTPSGALIKATLLNSCVDMTGISGYPSNGEGWGRVLLDNALYFTGDTSKLVTWDVRNASGLTTGQNSTYSVNVNSSATPLKITLVWTEPAAAVNANPAYINNLDLVVTDPLGNVYRGNVFTSGQSSTGGTGDIRNNVEMALRTAPTVGQWTVRVDGTAVNAAAKQGYALVVTGNVSTCAAPSIDDQPSDETVEVYGPASFSVIASGTGLTYQWKKDGDEIDGATGSSYNIPSATLFDEGEYSVVVTGTCGSIESQSATLSVNCLADFDGSGFVDVEDYAAFIAAFEAGDMSADIDGSGFVDIEDFSDFVPLFEAGC